MLTSIKNWILGNSTSEKLKKRLYDAIISKDLAGVKQAVQDGADINYRNRSYETALDVAVKKSSVEVVGFLLDIYRVINFSLRNSQVVVRAFNDAIENLSPDFGLPHSYKYAELMRYLEIIKVFIDKGILQSSEDKLYFSIIRKDLVGVKEAVQDGADINSISFLNPEYYRKETALHVATRKSSTEIAKFLLDKVKDFGKEDGFLGMTAFYYAAFRYSSDIMHAFIDKGQAQGINFNDGLCYAASDGKLDVMARLIGCGVDVNRQSSSGSIALCKAVRKNICTVKFLLDNGASINTTNEFGGTPLHSAASCSVINLEAVKLLLNNGASANTKDHLGHTPLRAIISTHRGGHLDVSKVLIKYMLLQDFNSAKPDILNDQPYPINYQEELSTHWDKCKAEIEEMREYIIGQINNKDVSLYNFLATCDDVKVVSYMSNEGILSKLNSIDFQGRFPIYADPISNTIQEREKKARIHNAIKDEIPLSDDSCQSSLRNYVIMKCLNCYLDNDSRKKLVRACLIKDITNQQPSSHVNQIEQVEGASSAKCGLIP